MTSNSLLIWSLSLELLSNSIEFYAKCWYYKLIKLLKFWLIKHIKDNGNVGKFNRLLMLNSQSSGKLRSSEVHSEKVLKLLNICLVYWLLIVRTLNFPSQNFEIRNSNQFIRWLESIF